MSTITAATHLWTQLFCFLALSSSDMEATPALTSLVSTTQGQTASTRTRSRVQAEQVASPSPLVRATAACLVAV